MAILSIVPGEAGAGPSDFRTWLEGRQQAALAAMRAAPGDEFCKHCVTFEEITTAIRVLWNFEVETDMANGGAA
jgi:hypothetical protein